MATTDPCWLPGHVTGGKHIRVSSSYLQTCCKGSYLAPVAVGVAAAAAAVVAAVAAAVDVAVGAAAEASAADAVALWASCAFPEQPVAGFQAEVAHGLESCRPGSEP